MRSGTPAASLSARVAELEEQVALLMREREAERESRRRAFLKIVETVRDSPFAAKDGP